MKKSALIMSAILAAIAPCTAFAAAPAVSTDVSLDSTYYDYIDKLDGMGYIESMPMGARPYSRMMMTKWTIEAAAKAKDKPMPKYLAAYLTELQREFAPEIASIEGSKQKNNIRLRSASMQLAYTSMDADKYKYNRGIRGSWQPFSQGNNGYKYGDNGNLIFNMEISGQLDKNAAILLRPRFSYDKDENGSVSLEEGYIKTHIGTVGITAGKEALDFGQGVTGKLALSNNAKPFTMLRLNLLEPQKIGGFFRFLGKEDYNVFYGRLEGNRDETAASNGEHDYDHPGILGMRADYMPTSRFTFGVERISIFGGDGNALNHKDWGDWAFGVNSDADNDHWDDIAGVDFRYRFPGMSIYGELYGEDQANYLPSKPAQRIGFYFPQLTKDGSLDMRVEYAHTTDVWYDHWTYNNGWVYNDNIMGDSMGPDANKFYIGIKHYLNNTDSIGLHAMRVNMSRESAVSPKLNQFWLTYDHRLDQNIYLDMMAGAAKISNASFVNGRSDKDYIVSATLRWQY